MTDTYPCSHASCPTLVPGPPMVTGYPRIEEWEQLHVDADPVVVVCPGHHFAAPDEVTTPEPTLDRDPICALCRSTNPPPFLDGEGWVIEVDDLTGEGSGSADLLAMHDACASDRGLIPTHRWRAQLAPRVRQWRREQESAA